MTESELHMFYAGEKRDPITISAYVKDGFAIQLVRHYEDIDRPRSEQQDRQLALLVFQKPDSEWPVKDEIALKEQLEENQRVWHPLYIHDITDYAELDAKAVLDEQDANPEDLRFVELKAGPFMLHAAGSRGRFDIFSVEFKTDDRGRPATQDMIDWSEDERRKQREKDQISFERQFGISSYAELPGEGH